MYINEGLRICRHEVLQTQSSREGIRECGHTVIAHMKSLIGWAEHEHRFIHLIMVIVTPKFGLLPIELLQVFRDQVTLWVSSPFTFVQSM